MIAIFRNRLGAIKKPSNPNTKRFEVVKLGARFLLR